MTPCARPLPRADGRSAQAQHSYQLADTQVRGPIDSVRVHDRGGCIAIAYPRLRLRLIQFPSSVRQELHHAQLRSSLIDQHSCSRGGDQRARHASARTRSCGCGAAAAGARGHRRCTRDQGRWHLWRANCRRDQAGTKVGRRRQVLRCGLCPRRLDSERGSESWRVHKHWSFATA